METLTKGFQIAVGVGNVKLLDLLKDFKPTTEIMKNYLHFAMIQNKGSVINSVQKMVKGRLMIWDFIWIR